MVGVSLTFTSDEVIRGYAPAVHDTLCTPIFSFGDPYVSIELVCSSGAPTKSTFETRKRPRCEFHEGKCTLNIPSHCPNSGFKHNKHKLHIIYLALPLK